MVAVAQRLIEAEPEEAGLSSKGLANFTRLVQDYVDAGRIAGGLSAVARHGKIVHFETAGLMDVEARKPLGADTIFRVYSMTKPIPSVALMTLYEEGRFQLSDPASKYIPEFKGLRVYSGGTADGYTTREPAAEMTVRDLLMHTSGLVNAATGVVGELYARAELQGSASGGTLADMVAKVGRLPLYCDPGSQWNYGISTDLVGYLCEVISGTRLDLFVKERVLDPLGMKDSGFSVPEGSMHRFAANYQHAPGASPAYTLADRADSSSIYSRPRTYFSGAGGMVSTASDYLRFCQMLVNGGELDGKRVLGTRTVKYMATNHLPGGTDLTGMHGRLGETTMDGIGFGLGFAVLLDPATAQVIGTPGEYYWGGAASTAFFVNPAEDLTMVFMTQLRPSSAYPIRREIRQIVYSSIID